ncbi:hypothetical protein DL769_011048 [Monosporascus sp. CRB-8-3]|nr:hypothetical protein DL769_011048 [Monosporascus sp. CRB-8-3]
MQLGTLISTAFCLAVPGGHKSPGTLRCITLEEHWVSPALLSLNTTSPILRATGRNVSADLREIGHRRLTSMTVGDVEIRVLSKAEHPAAMNRPSIAWASLTMTLSGEVVTELGCACALIDNHLDNCTFYDSGAPGHLGMGLAHNVGLHFLRFYGEGVFEEFPRLKVVLGHIGEVVPFTPEPVDVILSPRSIGRATLLEVYKRKYLDRDV